ncbi:diguanylate cyclase [Magnetococcales bacterium HHB-1]
MHNPLSRVQQTEVGRILLVDDLPSNIQVLHKALGKEHQVFFATNGKTALKMSLEKQPDLILLDVDMPGMDGFEVCRRLKEDTQTKHIPVIFVTAMDQEEDEIKGLQLGATDFIPKPIRPAVVALRVQNHLQLKRYRERLEAMSFLDGLTNIPNRRWFDNALNDEWRRSMRHQGSLSVILMDVDHFKKFNDHYGHQEGDYCLKKVAKVLQKSIQRPTDLVARYGGEEFVALLPDTDYQGLIQIAEKFREVVEQLAIPHQENTRTAEVVTISVGGASMIPLQDDAMDHLLKEADRCLYQAKKQGRNRIHCIEMISDTIEKSG